jgi:DNA-binding response OmpR family regulator
LLEFEGFQVVTVDRAIRLDDLLEQLRKEKPALIFVDVHLKSFNGFDLVKRLRQDADLKSTRVLMSSGMELSAQSHLAGADDFILKPFMPEELVDKIRNTIGS